MTQYIDKAALVAEIESKIEKNTKRGEESDAKRDGYGMYWGGVLSCLNEVRTLCDTLEVIEFDFEKGAKNADEHPDIEAIKAIEDHAYFAGSEAMREKMTNKACEWLKDNWRKHVWLDGDNIIHLDLWENDFRKAMEE